MKNSLNNSNQKLVLFIRVYLYPSLLALLIFGIILFLTYYFCLDRSDLLFGAMFAAAVGFIYYIKNRMKWILLGDSSTDFGDELDKRDQGQLDDNLLAAEPTIYVKAFYTRLSDKIMNIVCGLIIFGAGLYIMSKSSVIFPSILMFGGFIMIYSGCKQLKDRVPKLKLTKEGLWTKQLGYKYWDLIEKCEVVKEKSGRSELTYLNVILKNNEFDFPDDQILIDELKDGPKIKEMIDELKNNRFKV